MRRLLSCLAIALTFIPAAASLAQRPDAAALTSLASTLRDSSRVHADAYIKAFVAGDSGSRAVALRPFLRDTTAAPFYLAAIRAEPAAHERWASILNFGSKYLFWRHYAAARDLLADLVKSDPDSTVAIEALRQLTIINQVDLRELVDARIGKASLYALGDPIPGWLGDMQERAIAASNGWVTPLFMRTAPAVFDVVPARTAGIRVLAFGDWGSGSTQQKDDAVAMRRYHAKHPFTFGITLGDNFYTFGLPNPTHERWKTQYEELYSPMGVKIYAALGNHDQYDGDSPAAEITRSTLSKTWRMPAAFYSYAAGPAQFFAIDGNDLSERQLQWLKTALEQSKATWKVVYGHFPIDVAAPGLGPSYTSEMKEKLLPILKGRADVYVAGHHHSTQHLKPMDGVALIVEGSGGASGYPSDSTYANALFARTIPSFAVFDIDAHRFTLRFINFKGEQMYTATLLK